MDFMTLIFEKTKPLTALFLAYVLLSGSIIPFAHASAKTRFEERTSGKENTAGWTEKTTDSALQISPSSDKVKNALSNLPLSFEINRGQLNERVRFLSRGNGYSLFLTSNEAVLNLSREISESGKAEKNKLQSAVIRMKMAGANPNPGIEGLEEQQSKSNYFIGKDSKRWQTGVSNFARVKYSQIYRGIDLVYYGKEQQLEYDFIVSPGADPKKIKLEFKGAEKLSLDNAGNLVLETKAGNIIHQKPVIYQENDGKRNTIPGDYVINGKQVRFKIGDYDSTKPLVIDPVIAYSTYLGGQGAIAHGIAVHTDSATGKVYTYVAGCANSAYFPTKNALPTAYNQYGQHQCDGFLTKFDMSASGENSVIYSTYFGGTGVEEIRGIAVDSHGNAYLAGRTTSNTDFPLVNAPAQTRGGAFVAKINAAGTDLMYSMSFGGDGANDIAVDSSGNAYVIGTVQDTIPTTSNALKPNRTGTVYNAISAFVSKIASPSANNPNASFAYSTYLGGSTSEWGSAIAVDSVGNIHVIGSTGSSDFPIVNGFHSTYSPDGIYFYVKLDPTASGVNSLIYSTFLPSARAIGSSGVAVDASGNAYITGVTNGGIATTPGVFRGSEYQFTQQQRFAARINPSQIGAASLVYSTYLDPVNPYSADASIAVDSQGNAYVAGSTFSADFPLVNPIQFYNSGVFTSINGGDSFTVLNKGLTNLSTKVLAIDTSTVPRTLYTGTTGGVFKSLDGGNNWVSATTGLGSIEVLELAVDPTLPSTLFAQTAGGLYKSVNGGETWSLNNNQLIPDHFSNFLVFDTDQNVTTLYAGTLSGIYKSTDRGANWTATSYTTAADKFTIDTRTTPHTLYVSTFYDRGPEVRSSVSTDGGSTWNPIYIGPEADEQYIAILDIDTNTSPSTLYGFNFLYGNAVKGTTTPQGISWTEFQSPFHYESIIKVDTKTSPSTIYVGTQGGLYKSVNGGETWSDTNVFLASIVDIRLDGTSTAAGSPSVLYLSGAGGSDAVVAKLNPSGSALDFSTYVGGSGQEHVGGIAVDGVGNIYIAGLTTSNNLPTVNAYQQSRTGYFNTAFVTKIGTASLPTASSTSVSTEVAVQTGTLAVTLPNIQDSNTNDGMAPTTAVEPLDNSATANFTVSNNLGAYDIKVNNATIDTTGYYGTDCSPEPCWEKYGIKIAFSVPTVNDAAVFNNLVISHGEDTDNNPNTALVLVPYDQTQGSASHTYKDFATRTIWIYVPSLSPFVILKGAKDQLSDLTKLVRSFNLRQGIENSLDAKLQNASKAYTAVNNNDRATACNVTRAFISEVQSQSGRAITVAQAQQLTTSAKQIQVVLGCG